MVARGGLVQLANFVGSMAHNNEGNNGSLFQQYILFEIEIFLKVLWNFSGPSSYQCRIIFNEIERRKNAVEHKKC